MTPKIGESIIVGFITYSIDDDVVDADAAPVCKVFENDDTEPVLTLNASKRGTITGSYYVSIDCTLDNGFHPGQSYNVEAEATILEKYTRSVVHTFQVQSGVLLDLDQSIPDSKAETVGGALAGLWAVSWGKLTKNMVAKTLNLFGPGNHTSTPSESFQLDDVVNPTERIPQ